jgi:hypothetical protein
MPEARRVGPAGAPRARFWRKLRRSPTALAGGALLVAFYGIAAFGGFLAPYPEGSADRDRFYQPPAAGGGRQARHLHGFSASCESSSSTSV